jgi:prolyl-tRNA synthetase
MSMDGIAKTVADCLEEIQAAMYERAAAKFAECVKPISSWDEVVPSLDAKCAVVMPWCEEEACEDAVKDRSKSQ